jgi:hypothetical protein
MTHWYSGGGNVNIINKRGDRCYVSAIVDVNDVKVAVISGGKRVASPII